MLGNREREIGWERGREGGKELLKLYKIKTLLYMLLILQLIITLFFIMNVEQSWLSYHLMVCTFLLKNINLKKCNKIVLDTLFNQEVNCRTLII